MDQPASVILLIGPCGAGKTSALARMRAVLADRAGEIAVLETDTIYQMIDPTWSAYNARRAAICAHVTAMTAAHFLEAGFDWVVVGSNGLQERRDAEEFIARLPEDIDVFSFFLDPSTAAVQARIQGRSHPLDEHKTPEWVAENVAWSGVFTGRRPRGSTTVNCRWTKRSRLCTPRYAPAKGSFVRQYGPAEVGQHILRHLMRMPVVGVDDGFVEI